MKPGRSDRNGMRVAALSCVLAMLGGPLAAAAMAQDRDPAVEAAPRPAARHHGGSALEDRVRMLSRALDLDAGQQDELRKVFEDQRVQVARLRNDPSLAGPYAIAAMQVISDRTADRIRELLNDEQKQKYNSPRPAPGSVERPARPDIEAWMNPGRTR